jgi:hypothetical protein
LRASYLQYAPVVPQTLGHQNLGHQALEQQALEQRVARLEDRFAINDLVVTYATLLDDAQWENLAQLFTVDAVFSSVSSTTTGRAAIIENFKVKHAPFSATWHDPHGIAVNLVDEDHARGTVIGYAELGQSGQTLATSIRYQDDYRREDGVWRFAKRFVLSVYSMPLSELSAGALGDQERKRWPGRPPATAELPDFERVFPGYPG